jgi:hypothetical protein
MSKHNGNGKYQELIKKLAALDNSKRQELASQYIVVNPEKHPLSMVNTILIYLQNSGRIPVTMVAGYKQWQKYGRQVTSGQHGFSIRFPLKPKSDKDNDDTDDSDSLRFLWATVFDVTQTEEKAKY